MTSSRSIWMVGSVNNQRNRMEAGANYGSQRNRINTGSSKSNK